MNKDLDDRLIPNGEYRDAQNISVGKSEDDDIGALETVLGNTLMTNTDLGNANLQVIGQHTDKNNNRIFVFLTDNTPITPGTNHYIYQFTESNQYTLLVSGEFLNFSTESLITGISLIEELLFFTDNRNQPRKINVKSALVLDYYTNESQISVAKYNPYEPIELMSSIEVTGASLTLPNKTITLSGLNTSIKRGMSLITTNFSNNSEILATEYLYVTNVTDNTVNPTIVTLNATPSQAIDVTDKLYFLTTTMTGRDISPEFDNQQMPLLTTTSDNLDVAGVAEIVLATANLDIQEQMVVSGGTSTGSAKITAISADGLTLTLDIVQTIAVNSVLSYSLSSDWPGDPDYLEGRYVRFSYRFQYDDGEYSIMAPFTQIAFIPKQKGYFLAGDEDEAYKSTVLEFMENGVQNVALHIKLPDNITNLQAINSSSYKIKNIDILYKESDSRAVKVVDTIEIGTVADTAVDNVYIYQYQSAKPFRTLPESQTVRVFDKVPVLAQAQETAGNRVIYANFRDKYTPPSLLEYQVAVAPKFTTYEYNNWVEYPNHSVKQNRNYQVGFILADKFGRQSSVILSSIKDQTKVINNVTYGGSTVYSPYNSSTENLTETVKDWFGDALRVIVNSPINDTVNSETGTPGLYANARGTGFDVAGNTVAVSTTSPFTYTFIPVATTNIPQVGDYLRGEYKDFVKVTIVTPPVAPATIYTVTCDGAINKDIYELTGDPGTQIKYAYTLIETGWYSYKIVVKQNEQEYYNVYLPGIVKGYPFQDPTANANAPTFPPGLNTSNIVLFNDNINKIPRDLTEVGPDQKQYRSSVQLFGRVENIMSPANPTTDPGVPNNIQFYPRADNNVLPLTDTAISISAATDSNMAFEVFQSYDSNEPILYSTLSVTGQNSLYQLDTNPLIARLSTSQDIGAASLISADTANPSMTPFLAVYETEAVDSLLDIYWETTTVGLIADLNAAINTDFDGPVGFSSYTWVQPESLTINQTVLAANVQPVDKNGADIYNTTLLNYQTTNSAIQPVNTTAVNGGYNFKIINPFVYLENSSSTGVFTLSMNIQDSNGDLSGTLQLTGNLSNSTPIINGGNPLTSIPNNTGASGVITTLTGTNGSADSSNNLQQLEWSITGGNTLNRFSINSSNGELTQTSANAGTYDLIIRLTDANSSAGSLFVEATQQVVVSSTQVGYFFYGSPSGTFLEACPAFDAEPANCNAQRTLYYSQSVLSSGLPTAGSEIRTGPSGTNSPLAVAGFYSVGQCTTGAARMVMYINNNNGIVATGYPKSCNA
tara:strand:+ start:7 stop:3849 length:3843 start_codon:yes stop_codon:yes gene_type:complete